MTEYRFVTGDGEPVQGWEAIVPIFRADEFPKLICIGTGFFIHVGGILATAAHVMRDVLDKNGDPEAGLMTIQYVHPNIMIRRNITNVTMHGCADVAVAAVETLIHKETGNPLRNEAMIMTTKVPKVGDYVATWAFPKSVSTFTEKETSVSIGPKLYEGEIKEEHRDGRDSVMLPGPCYETNLGVEKGASGGPVFDENGRVFAILSTGFEGTDTAFISHVQSMGGLPIARMKGADGEIRENTTVGELIKRGEIHVMRD